MEKEEEEEVDDDEEERFFSYAQNTRTTPCTPTNQPTRLLFLVPALPLLFHPINI
jgi:hypothetical protein